MYPDKTPSQSPPSGNIQLSSSPRAVTPPSNDEETDGKRELLSTLVVIILAPIIALLLTMFVFQSYEVDGPSMEETLQDNDRLIVNKVGKTWSSISGGDYIPDRYSIVVFEHGNATGNNGDEQKQLIKRVIGLPGDRVVIKNGLVTVFNAEHPGGFAVDQEGPEAISAGGNTEFTDGNVEQTVKEGEVFVLGDNRDNSLDSRAFGAIDSDKIVGTLSVRLFPFDTIKKF